MDSLFWVYASSGAALVLAGIPLRLQRIPPNDWYGLRIEATRRNTSVWYQANELMGRYFCRLGLSLVALAAIGWFAFRGNTALYALAGSTALLGGLLLVAVLGIRYARRCNPHPTAERLNTSS